MTDKLSKIISQIQTLEQRAFNTQNQLVAKYQQYAEIKCPFKTGDFIKHATGTTVYRVVGIKAYQFDYRRVLIDAQKVLPTGKLAKPVTTLDLTPTVRLAEKDEIPAPKPKATTPPKKAAKKPAKKAKAKTKSATRKTAAKAAPKKKAAAKKAA